MQKQLGVVIKIDSYPRSNNCQNGRITHHVES
jgi:hypothetical protein